MGDAGFEPGTSAFTQQKIRIIILFQLRHTRSPSDNSLHLSTSEFASKKFTLERADSAGETMQGRAERSDIASAAEEPTSTSSQRPKSAVEGLKYSADSSAVVGENGPGRPVSMSYSCPRPLRYGRDLAAAERSLDGGRMRRTSVSCESSSSNSSRGLVTTGAADTGTRPKEKKSCVGSITDILPKIAYIEGGGGLDLSISRNEKSKSCAV